VLRLVVWQGLRPALAGVAAGLAGALAAGRLFAGILYEVRPTDPVVFAGGAVLVLLTVIAACLVPARRALSIPAAIALREE
jgi:hypothetical protein